MTARLPARDLHPDTLVRVRSFERDYLAAQNYRQRQATCFHHYDTAPSSDPVRILIDRVARLEWEAAYELPRGAR